MGAGQGVSDGGTRCLRLGDPPVEFGELELMQFPPIGGARRTGREKRPEVAQRVAEVSQKEDLADQIDGRRPVASLARDPDRRREQAQLLPVAQRRGGDTGAVCQLADRQLLFGHLDIKRT